MAKTLIFQHVAHESFTRFSNDNDDDDDDDCIPSLHDNPQSMARPGM